MALFGDATAPGLRDRDSRRPADAFWRTQGILSERAATAEAVETPAEAPATGAADEAQSRRLLDVIVSKIDDDKGEDIVVVDMAGKSTMCDFMVIASGRSQRQVAAMAEHLRDLLKPMLPEAPAIEGLPQGDWVLVDAGDVVVHLFRPEVRAFYKLERMWGLETPAAPAYGGFAEDPVPIDPDDPDDPAREA